MAGSAPWAPRQKPPGAARLDPRHPSAAGLVAYYAFAPAAGAVVRDVSRHRYDAATHVTAQDTAWQGGVYGPSLAFNGTSDYLLTPTYAVSTAPGTADPDNRLTMMAVVRTTALSSRNVVVGSNATGHAPTLLIDGADLTGSLAVYTGNDGFLASTGAGAIPDTGWHVVHYARRGATASHEFWVDGRPVALAANGASAFIDTPIARAIGQLDPTNVLWNFAGNIATVAIWGRDLRPAEIVQLAQRPNGMLEPSVQQRYWSLAAPSGPAGITIGALTVTPTYRGLAWELTYTGDDAEAATVAWTFTKSGGSARAGLPAWRVDKDTTGAFLTPRAFYGKVLLATPGTAYTIAVTVTDANGVVGTNPVTWTGSTLTDSVADPSTLTATKFVSPTGSDSNAGTSSGAAWLTVDHALTAATSGDVIQFAPGFYAIDAASQVTKANLTLLGQVAPVAKTPTAYSGVTYQQMAAANGGSRTIFHSGFYTSPTGSGDSNAGIWTSVNLTGPATGGSYQVWKCTLGTALPTSLTTCLYAATKTGDPARINVWPTGGTVNTFTLTTAAGFAEVVRTNQTHNYGIWADPVTATDLYVRLPADANPNSSYLFLGHSHNNSAGTGLWVTAAGCRVAQIEFLGLEQGITSNQSMSNLVVDTCLFEGCHVGVYSTGTITATPPVYSDRLLAQYNLFRDTNQWTASPATDTAAIPWNLLKNGFTLQAAAPGNGALMFQPSASNQPIAYQGVGDPQRLTWRYNTHDGAHDTFTLGGDPRGDRYNGYAADIHDNVSLRHQDDGFELSQGNMANVAIWNNVLQRTLSGMVINGTGYGPIFYFRNQHWMQGSDGEPVDHGASVGSSFPPIPGGEAVKYSTATASNAPYPRLFYLHNTLWTNSSLTATGTDGTETSNLQGVYPAAGGDGRQVHFYLRNNVLRVSGVIASQFPSNTTLGDGSWLDEDYNQFASSYSAPVLRVGPPSTDEATITGYRTLTSEGAHSQPIDDAGHDLVAASLGIDAAFVSTATGDLRLAAGAALIDAGTPVPNVSDLAVAAGGDLSGGGYYGTAPDLGALEYLAALALAGSLVGVGTEAGSLAVPYALAGGLAGVGLLAGALALPWPVGATLTGVGVETGALATPYALAGGLVGVGRLAGGVAVPYGLAGGLVGVGVDGAALALPYAMAAGIVGVEVFAATLVLPGQLAGLLAGVGAGSAALAVPYLLAGALAGVAVPAGGIVVPYALAGALVGVGSWAAALPGTGPLTPYRVFVAGTRVRVFVAGRPQ